MSISNEEALQAFNSLVGVVVRKDADTAWTIEEVRPSQRTFTKRTYRATLQLRGPWKVRVHMEVDESVIMSSQDAGSLAELLRQKIQEHAVEQQWYAQDLLRDKYTADLRIKK